MEISIINQTHKNECGICVLTSIHNYLYGNSLTKSDIIKYLDYDNKEISVYQLEIYANKIGINLSSYTVEPNELSKLENNKMFITCINNDQTNHYVICKRIGSMIKVYDSVNGIKKYDIKDFIDIFNGVYIEFSIGEIFWQKDKQKINNSKLNFNFPNLYLFSFLIIFIDLFSMLLSVLTSGFIKIIIDKIIPMSMTNDLFYFAIFFISLFIVNYLTNYIVNLIKVKKFDKLFKENIVIYTKILRNKSIDYFQSNSKEEIYEQPVAISKQIILKYFDTPSLIADLIIFVILTIIIIFTSYWFVIPVLINMIFIIVFGLLKYKNNNENYQVLNVDKNKIDINFNNYYNFLTKEKNYQKLKLIEGKWHEELWKYQSSNKSFTEFNMSIDLFDNSITKFVFVIFISVCSYLIINKYDNLSITNMIFLTSILNMVTNTMNDIFNYCCSVPFYKKNNEILTKIIDYKINYQDTGIEIDYVDNIKIENMNFSYGTKTIFHKLNMDIKNGTLLVGKNGSGKTTLFKILSMNYLDKTKSNVFVNHNPIEIINQKSFDKNIIYLPNDAIFASSDLTNTINSNIDTKYLVIDFLKKSSINLNNNNFSSGEIQLINLLTILDVKNKLIMFDESFSNVGNKYDELIYKKAKQHLEKNNFVIWTSHNKRIYKYFKNKENINDKC